jgi:hypothetical protein
MRGMYGVSFVLAFTGTRALSLPGKVPCRIRADCIYHGCSDTVFESVQVWPECSDIVNGSGWCRRMVGLNAQRATDDAWCPLPSQKVARGSYSIDGYDQYSKKRDCTVCPSGMVYQYGNVCNANAPEDIGSGNIVGRMTDASCVNCSAGEWSFSSHDQHRLPYQVDVCNLCPEGFYAESGYAAPKSISALHLPKCHPIPPNFMCAGYKHGGTSRKGCTRILACTCPAHHVMEHPCTAHSPAVCSPCVSGMQTVGGDRSTCVRCGVGYIGLVPGEGCIACKTCPTPSYVKRACTVTTLYTTMGPTFESSVDTECATVQY